MTSELLLEAQGLSYTLAKRSLFRSIAFQIYSGECLAILGRSGVGKSTLLKILAGHWNADSGVVLFRGKQLADPRTQLIRGHEEIQLVNQDFALDLFHNVEENLRIKLPGYVDQVKNDLIQEILEVVALSHLAKQQVQFLSGGEQQRLALARALIQEPDVLLLDEPFVHLDSGLRIRVERFIQRKVKEWQGAVILVTHDGREAMTWADKILYLNDGEVSRVDTPENFYHNPKSLDEALHFGHINLIKERGRIKMFRPGAFQIVSEKGIALQKEKAKFLGTHFENWMRSAKNEDILLYSQRELPKIVRIQPHYVGEK
jgi:ABC-type Fe3+/spermidine/putrescine transport system ATPase subunit